MLQQVLQGEKLESLGQDGGRAADVYACGVHLFKMLFQRNPFDGSDAASMSLNIMRGNIAWPNIEIHREIVDLLVRMLDGESKTRISVPDIMSHVAFLENLPAEVEVRTSELQGFV
jgi:serine/threonine protein kinase